MYTKYTYLNYAYESSIYGGSIFARYYVFKNFFAQAEYEVLNVGKENFGYPKGHRMNIESYLIGAGYRQNMGGRLYANILLLYNLNESMYSIYNNPILRVSFDIGL